MSNQVIECQLNVSANEAVVRQILLVTDNRNC